MRRYVLLALGTGLLVLYVSRVGLERIEAAARGFPAREAGWVLFANLVPGWLKWLRWRRLLAARGQHVRGFESYLSVHAAFFLGLVTPGTSGEYARAWSLRERPALGAAVVTLEKLADFGALLLLALLATVLELASGGAALVLVGATLAALLLGYGLARHCAPRWLGGLRRLLALLRIERGSTIRRAHREAIELLDRPGTAAFAFGVSLLLWAVPLLQMQAIDRGLGAPLDLATTGFVFFGPYLVGIVSMIPLGLGSFDWIAHRMTLQAGGAPALELAPLVFRLLVTLPLIGVGWICQLLLAVRGERG